MQTGRHNTSLMGLVCPLSASLLLAWVPIQCADAVVQVSSNRCHHGLSESLPVSTIEWSRPRQPISAQWPMPSSAGTAATREGTGHGTGSFVEASVEKSPYKWSPEASCHE